MSMTLGEYIIMRLEEEELTLEDLDKDTIDFFYQQWLIDPTDQLQSQIWTSVIIYSNT